MPYLLCWLLFLVGIFAVLTQRNIIRIILGLTVSEFAINLFLGLLGYRLEGVAPIEGYVSHPDFVKTAVDPLPQALVLTSIVIGLATLALAVVIGARLVHRHGTYDITQMKRLRG